MDERKLSVQFEEILRFTSKEAIKDRPDVEKPDLRGDRMNLFMLFFMYVIQNIPVGFLMAMPLFLQKRGVSYETQALIAFCRWPMTMKLLWAPIVDGLYSTRFGRRKSWIVPMQLIIAAILITLSYYIEDIIGSKGKPTNTFILIPALFFLSVSVNFQDVALDAWAITMMHKRNIGYAPFSSSLGFSIGMIMGNVALITLESAEFCNTWLRSTPQPVGLITLPCMY